MGAKGSAEAAAKLNADNWGHLEVCVEYSKKLYVRDEHKSN